MSHGVILPRDFLPKQPSGSEIALSVRGLWPLNDLQTDNIGLCVLLHEADRLVVDQAQ